MPENRILLYLEGKSDDADRAIDNLTRKLRQFAKVTSRARVEIEDKRAKAELARLSESLRRFGSSTARASTSVDTTEARTSLRTLAAEMSKLAARRPRPSVELGTGDVFVKIEALQARLRALDAQDVNITVKMRKQIFGEILALRQSINRLGPDMDVTAKHSHRFSNALNAVGQGAAHTGQAVGRLGASLGGARANLGIFTVGLNPMVAGLLAAAGVIATSFVTSLLAVVASAGQATVALGALAIGGFGALLAGGTLVGAMLTRYNAQMNTAGKAANMLRQSLGAMSEAFHEVATKRGAEILMVGLSNAVSALIPMVERLRPAFTSLGTDMAKAARLAGNDVAALGPKIAKMVTLSGPLFINLARAVGPLLEVLLNIANVALPYLTAAMGRLVETFKGWAQGTADAKKLDETIGGLVDHMRIWGDLIGSLGGLLKAFFSAIAPLGGRLVKDLTAAADKTAAWLRTAEGTARVREQFSKLAELTKQVAAGLGIIVVAIVNFSAAAAPAVMGVLTLFVQLGKILIDTFGPALQKLGELFSKIAEAIKPALPFFTNIVGPVISGVLQGIILALEPLIFLLGKFAEFLGWVGKAAEPLKPIFEGLGKVLGFIFAGPLLKGAAVILKGIGSGFGLIGRGAELAGKALSWIGGLIGKVLSGPLKALKDVGGAIGGAFKGLAGTTKTAWEGIKGAVSGGASKAKDAAVSKFNGLKSAAGTVWGSMKSAASTAWNSGIGQTIRGAATKAKDGAVTAFNGLKSGAGKAFDGVKAGASRVFGGLKDFVVSKVSAAGRAIGSLASGFYNMGIALIKGLIRGVTAMAANIAQAAKNVVQGAINAAKRLLRIGSPSKVFEGMGKNVGQGFADGILAMGGTVDGALKKTIGNGMGQLSAGFGTNLTAGVRPDLGKAVAGMGSSTREGDNYHFNVPGVRGSYPDADALLVALETKLQATGGLPSLP